MVILISFHTQPTLIMYQLLNNLKMLNPKVIQLGFFNQQTKTQLIKLEKMIKCRKDFIQIIKIKLSTKTLVY